MRRAFATLIFFVSLQVSAQDKLNVVQQAMRDELERSMNDLKAEGLDKPFFISYSIVDQTTINAAADFGALMRSFEGKTRTSASARLLVGDYEFNDESLDNDAPGFRPDNEIQFPIDDDYIGIRRSLWMTTNNVYKSAARQLARNKDILKEKDKPLVEVPHRTFAKVTPSKIDIESQSKKLDKKTIEEFVRKASAQFQPYKDLDYAQVSVKYYYGYRYLINSEGSVNRIPFIDLSIDLHVSMRSADNKVINDGFEILCANGELPALETLATNCKELAEKLIASKTEDVGFDDEYSGPVLLVGKNVAQFMQMQLFGREDGLMYSNSLGDNESGNRYMYQPVNSMDDKIGKPLFNENMTVKAVPKLKTYNNTPLLGSFDVDSEGVIPADETVLIEKGVLKTLMNDRTLTKPNQVANGLGDGPGNLQVSFQNSVAMANMKAMLIAQAKKQGLDYGVIVRNTQSSRMPGMDLTFYKIYVQDGHEEEASHVYLGSLSQRDFKKIVATSNEIEVHNLSDREGGKLSVICPKAILMEEMELKHQDSRNALKLTIYTPSPRK